MVSTVSTCGNFDGIVSRVNLHFEVAICIRKRLGSNYPKYCVVKIDVRPNDGSSLVIFDVSLNNGIVIVVPARS